MYGYGYTDYISTTGGIGEYPHGYGVMDPFTQELPPVGTHEDARPVWIWASVATNVALSGLLLFMIYHWPRAPPPAPPQTKRTSLWEKINPMYAGS